MYFTSLPVIQACCFLKTHVFSSLQIEKAEGESSQAKERERALTRGTVRVPSHSSSSDLLTIKVTVSSLGWRDAVSRRRPGHRLCVGFEALRVSPRGMEYARR